MAYINEEEINKIRMEADIVDVISDYLPLQQKGKNFVALCPFHNDHSPSLVVSRERQIFNCFTCRTGGNVFAFVMKYENVSFLEAISIVARKIGYNLQFDPTKNLGPLKREYEIYNLALKFYLNNLNTMEAKEAKEYLASRGITEEIIEEFKIGLALKEKDTLYQLLTSKKYSLDEIEKLGLVNKVGENVIDTFENRIMIPIANNTGQVVAFTGRIYHGEDAAKYVNTKETSIFKKSHILFNYANAKKYIRETKEVIIVEGNMDAIMLAANGIKNVVALMGVAISQDQITELQKLHARIILMLDSDNAGTDATLDLGEKLVKNNLDVRIVRLSGAKDPDEYIRKFGVPAMEDAIKHGTSYLDFKLNYLKSDKDLQKIPDVVKYIKEVLASLSGYDKLTKEMIITQLSENYHIDKEVLKENLKEDTTKELDIDIPKKEKRKTKYELATNKILYAMMLDSRYIRIYKEKLGYFKNKIERIIAQEIVYYNNTNKGINIADFLSYASSLNDEVSTKIMDIVSQNNAEEVPMLEFNNCLDVVLSELKKDEIKDLKQQLKNTIDVNEKMEILGKIANIKKEV